MLAPSDRSVLIEVLQPPEGFQLDRVIATTYSLDLMALLTLPLSFTLLAGDGLDEAGRADPVALLDALRRYAGRIHIFCQAGRIAVPPRGQPLFGYLEGSVFEAMAPNGGSFHPKLTVVRYVPDPSDPAWEGQPPVEKKVQYKVLCSTRNLTIDCSWDTLLVLEGELATDRTRAFSRNHPLGDFVQALPGLAVRKPPDEINNVIQMIADEVRRVRFETPSEFHSDSDDLTFWPIGLTKAGTWPFRGRLDRVAVVAPFLDAGFLERIMHETTLSAVVSRPESLAQLPRELFPRVPHWFVLNEGADPPEDLEAGAAQSTPETSNETDLNGSGVAVKPSGGQLQGLHVKLFVADEGRNARIWTGSANATGRAFERNVEFVVELRGKKSKMGIDALFGIDDQSDSGESIQLRSLLQPFEPPEIGAEPDEVQRKLEELLERAGVALVESKMVAEVITNDSLAEKSYDVSLRATAIEIQSLPPEVIVRIRPISLRSGDSVCMNRLEGIIARFGGLSFLSLTGFYTVTLNASFQGQALAREFVMRIPLEGAPPDRENQLLLAILSDRDHLLRYLLMLLGSPDDASSLIQGYLEGKTSNGSPGSEILEMPLLESILRTYADNPVRLEPLGKLIRDLETTEAGRKILPAELTSLWAAIREAGGEHNE